MNLNDGKLQDISASSPQPSGIWQLWALDDSTVAFGASERMANGDMKDLVYFYDPLTNAVGSVFIDQWKDSSDPRSIGSYTITPDKKIIYSSNNKIVIAPVTMLSASAEVGMVASHDYSSGYIVASDRYLVGRFDGGDIFVFNRTTGERTLIKGANVRSEITLDADEIAFVNRQEKTNDSVVYLDLKELPPPQPVN